MKKPYETAERECRYGRFEEGQHAGYTLTAANELTAPWYYIYQNRKILLYVDQNGPVKMQYQPPSGILIFKREIGETQSKWQVWIQSDDINEGVPFSNFNSPVLRHDLKKPEYTVNWTPTKAIYTVAYDTAVVETEIFVPSDKATVCMKTTIKNTSGKEIDITVTPAVFPYINVPQMVAWDLPEWYLDSKMCGHDGKVLTVHGQMRSPEMIDENNRSVTLNVDYEADAEFEFDMSKFMGTGSFFAPMSVIEKQNYSYRMEQSEKGVSFGGIQTVYAMRYQAKLAAGEEKTYTQVLTVQENRSFDESENMEEKAYFEQEKYQARVKSTDDFYMDLFSKRSIETSNPILNDFVNYFTPLQMYWVCSLDRGWPSSMRGIRDASQDFMGMIHLDPVWTRKLICELLEHQRKSDGWFPRQISTISRTAPHDMRYFCDGGAFFLELIHEYMTFTRDTSLLKEKVYWLESDEESTVLEHIEKTVDFYLSDENIGEHGLAKAWYGDWWDVMDKIGMDGRGESVTVTAQNVMNLKNLADMYRWLVKEGELDDSYLALAEQYLKAREQFKENLVKHAYNRNGFFNGYFNDNGKWLLSEEDPDGKERMYLVSNAWAVISGAADEKQKESVLNAAEKLCKGRMGYNLNSIGYAEYVDKAGRVGNGSSPGVGPYNHAQSFFVRACCVAGDAERAYDASRYIYPIEQAYAPVEKTLAPPYAIANCYSNSDANLHRVGFQFLSGTVSYVLRTFYSFFMGITFDYEGLVLKPCMPKEFGDCKARFEYLGKKFEVCYKHTEGSFHKVIFNGEEWSKQTYSEAEDKFFPYFADEDMRDENIIEIEY